MSSAGTRERKLPVMLDIPGFTSKNGEPVKSKSTKFAEGRQITESISNRRDPKTGNYYSGGSFYTSRFTPYINPGYVSNALLLSGANEFHYSGPVVCAFPTSSEMSSVGFANPEFKLGSKDKKPIESLGATAISLCGPTNPASDLGTSLAEGVREGIPSLPGIQSWKRRTEGLKALGSEYLNYQFGWAPLAKEVNDVVDATRNHANIMKQYQRGEGRNTHREFSFPLSKSVKTFNGGGEWPLSTGLSPDMVNGKLTPQRVISRVSEVRTWFVGCFTYGLPSSADSWRKHLGFGSQAEQLYGLALTPDVLWELTPWSWAVDWFTNAGDVINNVTQFGLAGQVMRYGYMMRESREKVDVSLGPCEFYSGTKQNVSSTRSSTTSCGYEVVTKLRAPASPFGFSVGWEGLSPTQLAITAALGITKLL